jgi:ATP-dependent RNA helicase RhlE
MRGERADTADNNRRAISDTKKDIFVKFNTFSFHPQINAGIDRAGFDSPTPIQAKTILPILEGRDVIGLAQTGTGKTAAFVLPILQKLMNEPRGKPHALILAPTRELAEQTHTVFKQLGARTGLRFISVYGGVSAKPQISRLRQGVDVVIACPGRLLDLHNQRMIDLREIKVLVLDEADHMVDMGFLPDVRRIIGLLPAKHQSLLFSATMAKEINSLVQKMLYDPITVEISITQPLKTINHAIYRVEQYHKLELLLQLLDDEKKGQVLVFTRTKRRASKLADQLNHAGVNSTSLQGNLSQSRRQKAMNAFRKGHVKVLVATDIAARGIDVRQVSHVINYDIPDTAVAYTHRTGRTGRMDNLGTALTLVTQEDMMMVRSIERLMGTHLELKKLDGFKPKRNVNRPQQVHHQRSGSASRN